MPPEAPFDDERLTTAGLLFEAHAGLTAALERRLNEECDLPAQWFEVLLRLARSPGHRLRMCDLAAQVALSPSGLTRAIDRLEEAELVVREHCPEDRRVAYASLTAAGLARIEAAVPVHLRHLDEYFMGVLTAEELEQLAATMRKVRDHVNPGADTGAEPAAVPDAWPDARRLEAMERQAGLGRSLREVIESLTPVEPEMAERLQFDASELIQRLDDLLVDVRDLRERVHHLTSIVGDEKAGADKPQKKKKKKKKK